MPRTPRVLAAALGLATLAALTVSAVVTAPAATAAASGGVGLRLTAGQSLTSGAGAFRLSMQSDGNLVEYSDTGVPLWWSGTAGRGASYLALQSDGNLVVYTTGGVATWASHTTTGQRLVVQNDGNVVLYRGTSAVWCTCALGFARVSTRPASLTTGQGLLAGDALVAGGAAASMQSDGNFVLRTPAGPLWSTATTAGNRSFVMLQSDGNLVVYGPDKRALWNSRTGGSGARTLRVGSDGRLELLTAGGTAVWGVGNGRSTPTGIAGDVFALLNRQRAANGLPALTSDSHLIASAAAHNARMSAAGTLSHQLPGEADPGARMTAAGYRWRAWAENIAWTTTATSAGAQALQNAMYGEKPPNDGHRQNILSRSVTQVGVAVLVDSHGKLWLTTDFAAPR